MTQDFVDFQEGALRLRGRDGIVAITALWLARDFLRDQVVPTAETEELLRQMDTPRDEEEARAVLRSFRCWAASAGVLVEPDH